MQEKPKHWLTYRIKKINDVTRGWINYFRIGSIKTKRGSIDEHLRTQIRVIIWKQWKVLRKRLWGLLKLGVPDWIANKVAYWGNHYQFVATKSVLARAVSKEKLTKRGLVSLSDYYLKVAHSWFWIEPPYAKRHVRWCERWINFHLLDCDIPGFCWYNLSIESFLKHITHCITDFYYITFRNLFIIFSVGNIDIFGSQNINVFKISFFFDQIRHF